MKKLPVAIKELLKKVTVGEGVDMYVFHATKYVKDESVRNQVAKLVLWFEHNCDAHQIIVPEVVIRGEEKQIEFFLRLKGEYKTYLTMVNR